MTFLFLAGSRPEGGRLVEIKPRRRPSNSRMRSRTSSKRSVRLLPSSRIEFRPVYSKEEGWRGETWRPSSAGTAFDPSLGSPNGSCTALKASVLPTKAVARWVNLPWSIASSTTSGLARPKAASRRCQDVPRLLSDPKATVGISFFKQPEADLLYIITYLRSLFDPMMNQQYPMQIWAPRRCFS